MGFSLSSTFRENPGWRKEASREAEETLVLVTGQLQDGIARRSPFKEGVNRRSIEENPPKRISAGVLQISTQSGYGGWLEVGTRKFKGFRYFMRAILWIQLELQRPLKKKDLERPLPDFGKAFSFPEGKGSFF